MADRIVLPLLMLVSIYVAILVALVWSRFPYVNWSGLIAVSVATAVTVAVAEKGRWPLGLFVSPRLALSELLIGGIFGATLIGFCALLVTLSTEVWHAPGRGFPWIELFAVFIPAAVHEELLFRGYVFQKLHRWNRHAALLLIALVFSALHAGNVAVTSLGLLNIFLGGLLLGLAYERFQRLWFPIGLHLAWNVVSGPILGHEVSGYDSLMTLFIERGGGPSWLTGGNFGIEGSVWMTVVEGVGIVVLWHRDRGDVHHRDTETQRTTE